MTEYVILEVNNKGEYTDVDLVGIDNDPRLIRFAKQMLDQAEAKRTPEGATPQVEYVICQRVDIR